MAGHACKQPEHAIQSDFTSRRVRQATMGFSKTALIFLMATCECGGGSKMRTCCTHVQVSQRWIPLCIIQGSTGQLKLWSC
jgi:hypothetical protein